MKITYTEVDTWESAMETINVYLREKNIKVNKVDYNPETKELNMEIEMNKRTEKRWFEQFKKIGA